MSGPEVGTSPGCSLPCPGCPGGWGHFRSLQGQVSFLPPPPCMLRGSHSAAFRRHNPTGCLSPAQGLGCTPSLCIRSCQWVGELRVLGVQACLGARLPAALWVHTCAPGCQATGGDAWVGPSQPCSSRSRRQQVPCRQYWACTNLLGQWPGSVQGARGALGGWTRRCWGAPCRVGSVLLGPADPVEDVPVVPALGGAFLSRLD